MPKPLKFCTFLNPYFCIGRLMVRNTEIMRWWKNGWERNLYIRRGVKGNDGVKKVL